MRTEENVAKFIYIMYSAIRKQYKIGETNNIKRRLSEVKNGSAGGDASTKLIDYFPVTVDMIPHRAKNNIDSVFHSCVKGGYSVTDGEWFRISKQEAYQVVIDGFRRLESDKEKYLLEKYGKVLNRRLNKIFNYYIKLTKKEFKIKMPKFAVFLERNRIRKYHNFYNIEIDERLIKKIFTIHYKSVLHNLPFYTNLFGKHFTLKGIIQIVKQKGNKLDYEDIKLITEYLKGFKSFVDVERRRLNYKLRRIYFSSNVKYDIEYNEMLLREYEHLITLDYFYESKKVEKYAVLDLSRDFLSA